VSTEAETAFYKGVKFWFTLLLAALLAWLVGRIYGRGEGEPEPQRVSNIR
jgi:hypothetical protein